MNFNPSNTYTYELRELQLIQDCTSYRYFSVVMGKKRAYRLQFQEKPLQKFLG